MSNEETFPKDPSQPDFSSPSSSDASSFLLDGTLEESLNALSKVSLSDMSLSIPENTQSLWVRVYDRFGAPNSNLAFYPPLSSEVKHSDPVKYIEEFSSLLLDNLSAQGSFELFSLSPAEYLLPGSSFVFAPLSDNLFTLTDDVSFVSRFQPSLDKVVESQLLVLPSDQGPLLTEASDLLFVSLHRFSAHEIEKFSNISSQALSLLLSSRI